MIDKLNFSGAGSNMNIESPQSSIGDSLLNLGKYFTQKDATEQERLLQAKKDQHALEREGITDARYEADKKERIDDKNRLLQKDYNTANAMSAIENKDAYIAGRMAAEQKAIQDTLANATLEERLQMQQELKGYDPKASGQQWASTALSQSNVDSKDITNLKRDITKENKREEEFNKKLKADQANADRAYSLNKMQYDQTALEKKDKEKATSAGVSAFMNNNVENSTLVSKDSKDGEMIIKDENLNAHKEAFNEFGKTKNIQELTSKLETAQQNASELYTDEQLADPVFVKKLYDESKGSKESSVSNFLSRARQTNPNYLNEDIEATNSLIKKQVKLMDNLAPLNKIFLSGHDKQKYEEELKSVESELQSYKDKKTKKESEEGLNTFNDFSTNLKASNKAKKDELVTLQSQLDSLYKTKDIELKNKFGTIKKENVYVPKEEKQYAQDIVTSEFDKAKKEGRTLSANEQAAIVASAKDMAKNHQVKVDKALDDELKVRIKKMEKATEAQKLEYNTYGDQIKVIDAQINKIAHGNAGEKDLYSINNPKAGDITPENAIIELKASKQQLVEMQKEIANKTGD